MHHLLVAGHRLEVRRHPETRPGAPPVVFLHEGLGSLRQWKDFPARVAARTGSAALAYSRWGYGGSESRPRPWSVDFLEHEAEAVLPALLEATGTAAPVLFGHSDGATIALMFASAFPGRVRGVISEAAHVMLEAISVDGITRARHRFLHGDLRARLHVQHGDHVDDTVLGWTENWLRPEFRAWDIRPRLRTVRCPVLLIQGRDDDFGTLDQVDAIATHVAGPVERLILDGCGHVPHRERAVEVLDAAAAFIAQRRQDRVDDRRAMPAGRSDRED
jgi:pimeloyl-ACP methyl ester carboxylesterase